MENRRFGNLEVIEGKNRGKYPFANTLLIDDEVRVLIDPAAGRKKMHSVLDGGHVDIIMNTHYHEDHVTYNHLFPDAELYFHEYDAAGYRSMDAMLDLGIGRYLTPALRRQYEYFYDDRFHFTGWEATRLLKDGDELQFGKTRVQVVHLPGHTRGHCGFFFPDESVLFCADVDLTSFGPWYGDMVGSIDDTIESTKKVRDFGAKYTVTSHEGPVYEDIQERAEMYINVVKEREQRVLDSLSVPGTLDEIAGRWVIYRKARAPEEIYLVGEKAMVEKHLERLVRNGLAVEEEGIFRAL